VKKLRLYDHLGQLVKEFDVYVEGQSFTWRSPQPEAIWLGTITLQDVDEEVEAVKEPILTAEEAVEKMAREEEEPRELEEILEDIHETTKRIEEETSEFEKPDDKSLGDTRTGEAEQLESLTVTPEAYIAPSVAKGSKGHRQPKSPKSAVGSRSRKRTTGSGRGKAKGTTIGGSDET